MAYFENQTVENALELVEQLRADMARKQRIHSHG
jgi:hypothetical protein